MKCRRSRSCTTRRRRRLTVFGQKGSGESGYLGAPAAIASAVNDAVRPLGIVVNSLPIKVARLGDMIAAAREDKKGA